MVLKFYCDLKSPPVREVWIFLKANNIDFEPHWIDFVKGEQLQPEFQKINPNHKVPTIDDDGFILTESAAIIHYLAAKHDVAEHWYPRSDPRQQAKTDELISWQQHNIRYHMTKIFLPLFMERLVEKGLKDTNRFPLDPLRVQTARDELTRSLKHLDEYFLAGKPYVLGDEISAADLICAGELQQLLAVGEHGCYEANGNVKNWMARVETRLEPHYKEAARGITVMKDMFK